MFTNVFPTYTKNGTIVTDAGAYLVMQTVSNTPIALKDGAPPNTKAKRLTWVEKR